MGEELYSYDAFISYRRSDGARFARRLRDQLRTFRLSGKLAAGRREPLSIYLDTIYERATNDFFDQTIVPALRHSKHLIVIHTPSTLQPRSDGSKNWVVREIEFFRTLPQSSNVSIALPKGNYAGPLAANLHNDFPNLQRVNLKEGMIFSGREREG